MEDFIYFLKTILIGALLKWMSLKFFSSVQWKKDNKVLDDVELYHFEKYEDTYCFEIKTVEMDDAGVYTCVAKNSEGEATCDIPLTVNGQ
jgi:hypothetical protein